MEKWEKEAELPLEAPAAMTHANTGRSISGLRSHGPGAFPVPQRFQPIGAPRPGMRLRLPSAPAPQPLVAPGAISTVSLKSLDQSQLKETSKLAISKGGDKVYAVDLDGTLAERYKGDFDPEVIGAPVKSMRRLVRLWTRRGIEVRIFTARAANPKNIPPIKKWLEENGMGGLKITNEKTPDIDRFIDDKAVAVTPDKGTSCHRKLSSVIAMYKAAAGTWRRPENFDKISDSGLPAAGQSDDPLVLYSGANDYERGWTWAAVYSQKDVTQLGVSGATPRVWIEVDHGDCPGCGGTCDPPKNQWDDCVDFGHDAVKDWVREAVQGTGGTLEDRLYRAAGSNSDVKAYGRATRKTADFSILPSAIGNAVGALSNGTFVAGAGTGAHPFEVGLNTVAGVTGGVDLANSAMQVAKPLAPLAARVAPGVAKPMSSALALAKATPQIAKPLAAAVKYSPHVWLASMMYQAGKATANPGQVAGDYLKNNVSASPLARVWNATSDPPAAISAGLKTLRDGTQSAMGLNGAVQDSQTTARQWNLAHPAQRPPEAPITLPISLGTIYSQSRQLRDNQVARPGAAQKMFWWRNQAPPATLKTGSLGQALQYGLVGAGAGGLVQLLRRSNQKQEGDKPSILNGMLLGGLGGVAAGAMMPGGQQSSPVAPAAPAPLTDAQINEVLSGSRALAEAQHTYRVHVMHGQNFAPTIRDLGSAHESKGGTVMVHGVWGASDAVPTPTPLHSYQYTMAPFSQGAGTSGAAILAHSSQGPSYLSLLHDTKGGMVGMSAAPTWEVKPESAPAIKELFQRGGVSAEDLAPFSPEKMPGNRLIENFHYTPPPPAPAPTIKTGSAQPSYLRLLRDKFNAARKDVHLTPSEAQREAGNYSKGHVWMNGFDITIENPKGSTRSGRCADGTTWKSTMAADYGDIRNYPRSKADGDNMDVFVGPHPSSEMAYVIDQYIDGKFDEHKIVLGCFTEKEAKAIYSDSFDDKWKGLGDVTALTIRQLKSWLKDGDTSKPLHGQNLAKHVKTARDECEREEKTATAQHCTRNTCPECGSVSTCRCPLPITNETTDFCDCCRMEADGIDTSHLPWSKKSKDKKLAADNSWMPAPVAAVCNNPMVSDIGLAAGSGALRGALVAALIHGARTLKRENMDQPKRDLNLTRDLMLGSAIGAGSGLLLHYIPEVLNLAHNTLGTPKAAHVMDVPLAPLHMGGTAGVLVGTGYGALVGAAQGVGGKIKRWVTGEPEEDGQFEESVLNGAQNGLNIGSMASLSGMNPASAPTLQAQAQAKALKNRLAPKPLGKTPIFGHTFSHR